MSLTLLGCSGGHTNSLVPGADLIMGSSGSTVASGVIFTLTPPALRTCEHPDGRMTIKASWDARASGATSVTIWVSNAGSEEKRWFHGGPVGSADTGPWAVDGLVFRVADGGKKGRTLVTHTFHAVTCLEEPQSAVVTQ